MASLRSQAKKSGGGALRTKAKSRGSLAAREPLDTEDPKKPVHPPSISPDPFAEVPRTPMPKYGYLNSFATIPALRKDGGVG